VADAPLDRMPVYLKAGAVLPMGPSMAYVGEKPADLLTLHVYPGEGRFNLYEDDGEGYGYRCGEYCRTALTLSGTRLTVGEPQGGCAPGHKRVEVIFHGVAGSVLVDGKPVPAEPAEADGLRVLVDRAGGFTVEVKPA